MTNTDELNEKSTEILESINTFISQVQESHLENEQWFLNFLDKMNELSVIW